VEGAVQGGEELSLGFFCFHFEVVIVVGCRGGAGGGLTLLHEDGGPQLSFGLVKGRGQTTDRETLSFITTVGAALLVIGVVVLLLIGVVVVVVVHTALFFLKCFFD